MAKSKVWAVAALVLLMVLAIAGIANAAPLPLRIDEVTVNGDTLSETGDNRMIVDRDNTLDIKVKLVSEINASIENVEVTAFISGYDYNYNANEKLSDTTRPFDIVSEGDNLSTSKSLKIVLPELLKEGKYKLRIVVSDADNSDLSQSYSLYIEPQGPKITIRDVVFSPDGQVIAGRALLTVVRIKNAGEGDQQGIKVNVAIPELDGSVSASQYIDELAADKSISSEELYMRIPACAKAGTYDVVTTVTYDEGHGKTVKVGSIEVTADDACKVAKPADTTDDSKPAVKEDKVVVSIAPVSQTVTRGEGGAIYQIALANEGSQAKTYTLSVDGADSWATTRISPSGIVSLNAGEQKTVYIYVTAKENSPAGTHLFSVNLNADGKMLKQLSASAEVVDAEVTAGAWQGALEIGAIVMLVLLVIVALVLGFNKMRGGKESQELTQTYY